MSKPTNELILECLAGIEQEIDNEKGDLTECGSIVIKLIHQMITKNLNRFSSQDNNNDEEEEEGSFLLRLCQRKFLAYVYSEIPSCWRRLYTDTVLLIACSSFTANNNNITATGKDREEEQEKWKSLIGKLDLAIIVSGSPGKNRTDWVLQWIQQCQSVLSPSSCSSSSPSPSRPLKKQKLDLSLTSLADSTICTFSHPPSLVDFLTCHFDQPFIVKRYAIESRAVSKWNSIEYLDKIAGKARIVPIEIGSNYLDQEWGQDIVLWSDFLHRTFKPTHDDDDDKPLFYLAQHNLFSQFPNLESDLVLPDYVYSAPPCSLPSYTPPTTSTGILLNTWLGPKDTLSPVHYDSYFNCFIQVVGYKEIWISPPSCSSFLQPQQEDEEMGVTDELMSKNTCWMNVFPSDTNTTTGRSREEKGKKIRTLSQRALLEPGDLLYLPPGWWHSLKSLSMSFSVSCWF